MNKQTDFFQDKNVLVTGGAGFVGTNLIKKLAELKANVRATFYRKFPQYEHKNIEYVFTNLKDSSYVKDAVRDMDYVFMCAAVTSGAAVIDKDPLIHVHPNTEMNSMVLDEAHKAGVKKFLFISSTVVYPETDHPVCEDDMEYGNFFHKYFFAGWMKQYSEVMCKMHSMIKNPMPVIVVRPANLYGEYDDFDWETSHMPPAQIRKVVERHNPITVWGDGNDVKDLLYVGDFVDGMLLAMEKIQNFEILNIASGVSVTTMDVLQTALQIEGYSPEIVFDASKPSMIPKRLIDTSKAEKLIGFKAQTSLYDGMKATMEWYKKAKM